jgi:EAL domain-containing protein (putative c-di-GMP-specific phosphodiesterase class I)
VFLPIAEPTVLMADLTRWVLRHAAAEAKRWLDAGVPAAIAVNISPRTLTEGSLEAMVAAVLVETALPPELLELEVTETAIMGEPERAATVLRNLRALGVRVAIDDFGVGYTSLALLKTLPIDVLKIDRVFINRLLSSKQDRAIVESVINLGHQLGLQVVAEGVESVLAWEALEQMGCDEIQGFVLSPPVDAQAFGAWRTVHDATAPATATATATALV